MAFVPLKTGASVIQQVVRFNNSYSTLHFSDERALNSLQFLHGPSAGFLRTRLLRRQGEQRPTQILQHYLGHKTFSTRSGTPKWRPTASRTFGEADLRPWAS